MVEDWERDKRGKCPYEETPSGIHPTWSRWATIHSLTLPLALTIHDVQLELAKEEMEASKSGRTSIHQTSASKFLLHGLNLEEKQSVSLHSILALI